MRKKITGLVVALCMLISFLPCAVSAYTGTKYGDIYYEENNGAITITDCVETVTAVAIPNQINGLTVTKIGNDAFCKCTNLKSVTIPASVTRIEYFAFQDCTSLTNITLPDGLTYLGDYAFRGCTSLRSVTISAGVTADIRQDAFKSCSALENITADPNNSQYSSIDGNLFNKNKTELLLYAPAKKSSSYTVPSGAKIRRHAFSDCANLTSVIIPPGVDEIANGSFYGCKNLIDITIPNGVTIIDDWAFYQCTGLTEITLPESLISIDEYAFDGCTGLTEITLPANITSIGRYSFNNCTKLKNITIPESVTSIGQSAFSGCTNLTDVYYGGTDAQWKKITDGKYSVPINANIHFGKGREVQVPSKVSGEIALPQTNFGASYIVQLTADDGKSYKWEMESGIMPTGLTMSQNGMITGTPLNPANYSFIDIKLTDSDGNCRIEPFSMSILPQKVHIEPVGASTVNYDGKEHALQFRCVEVPELELSVTYGTEGMTAPTEAGTYYARVFSKSADYQISRDTDYYLTINRQKVKITHSNQTYTYDGKPHPYQYTATDNYMPVIKYKPYSNDDDLVQPGNDSDYIETPPTSAGRYRVWISTADKNHSIYDDSNRSNWYVFGEMTISE